MVEYYPPLAVPPRRALKGPVHRPVVVDKSCVLCLLPDINSKWRDFSQYGNHGTITGATQYQRGRRGPALYFDGTDDFVSCGVDSSFDITANITLEAWAKATVTVDVARSIIGKRGGAEAYGLRIVATNQVEFDLYNGGVHEQAGGNNSITVNQWHHLVGTYDGATQRVYVDATEKATTSFSSDISTSNLQLGIGSVGGDVSNEPFAGYIDEVRIYSRALAAWEIRALYEAGRPP